MKVFISDSKSPTKATFTYPEDMEMIIDYLTSRGQIFVNSLTLEELYRQFSEDRYSAGWMTVDPELLSEFANYLEDLEI